MALKITARAPSSTANLGPGFDVFGLALDAYYDEVTLTKIKDDTITIVTDDNIPTNPRDNTAGLVVENMREQFKIKDGIKIRIKKGIPAGFGMGSSAASAAAAAVAFDKLFELELDGDRLVKLAGFGEKASAGSVHYDNVAASVLGGFVIVRTNPLKVTRVEPPASLRMCVAVPDIEIPEKKTEVARGVIPKEVSLADCIQNISNASAIVAGFMGDDPELIGSSIKDVIVEPARKPHIPGFDKVKQNALDAGALGVTISGAGPSIIAFSSDDADMKRIGQAMSDGFASAKIKCQTVICKPSSGCYIKKEDIPG